MTKIIILAFVICLSFDIQAQNAIYNIGTGRNEVAKVVKNLPDGSSVVAGYIYDLDPGGQIINSDNLCFRIAANGTILWQQQWGTSGADDNDFLYDMIITSADELVCAGTAGRTTVYNNNTAALYKLDINTGAILNQYFFRQAIGTSPLTTEGDVYFGVCETTSGDFVAVGAVNYTPYSANPLISFISGSTFTSIYDVDMSYHDMHSDVFTSVVADNNNVFIAGYNTDVGGGSLYDQVIVNFDPYSGPKGTAIWQQSYDFGTTITTPSQTITLNSNYPFKINHDGNRLVISGMLYGNWNGTNGDRHYIYLR